MRHTNDQKNDRTFLCSRSKNEKKEGVFLWEISRNEAINGAVNFLHFPPQSNLIGFYICDKNTPHFHAEFYYDGGR